MSHFKRWYVLLTFLCVLGIGSWQMLPTLFSHSARANLHPHAAATTPISHAIVIMMENHSFDNLFGRFPGANGVLLPHASNPLRGDNDHTSPAVYAAMDNGAMDEFPLRGQVQYTQADIPNYWAYAQRFGLSDNFFTSMATSSTPNHVAMVASQSGGIDVAAPGNGCASTQNMLVYSKDAASNHLWTYPCYNINSLPQELTANGISWKYYSAAPNWDAPKLIQSISGSPNDIKGAGQFTSDILAGQLADVSWVTPPPGDSDHPPQLLQLGQNFITGVVNDIMNSSYWANTAIFVTWDDWGGWYDHVPPPQIDAFGLGPRAPLLVISPYAKQGYISHQQAEDASFDKFIEENWGLPNLGQRDSVPQTSDLMDFFDFSQTPQQPLILNPLPYSLVLKIPSKPKSSLEAQTGGTLNPTIGGANTTFTYSIVYTAKQTPTITNVTIDNTTYPMVMAGKASGGTLYQYSTKLGVGSHTFSFTFSNPKGGTVTWPDNGIPFAGPDVYPFSLKRTILNAVTLPGQTVTFEAVYSSPANKPPTLAEIEIDGVPHTMTPTGGTDYVTGVLYKYSTNSLSIGQHYHRYLFNDGSGVAIYESGEKPVIDPMTLTNASVSPTSGISSTVFTFQTTYTESANQAPTQALLYVDNTAYPMTLVSGSYNTGAVFQVSMTLPNGNHMFSFVFTDSHSSWAEPFAPGEFAGPNVGSNAKSVSPGTILYPDQDQSPNVEDQSTND